MHSVALQGSVRPGLTTLVMTTQLLDGRLTGMPVRQLVKVTAEVSDQAKEPFTCSSFSPSHVPAGLPVDTKIIT